GGGCVREGGGVVKRWIDRRLILSELIASPCLRWNSPRALIPEASPAKRLEGSRVRPGRSHVHGAPFRLTQGYSPQSRLQARYGRLFKPTNSDNPRQYGGRTQGLDRTR